MSITFAHVAGVPLEEALPTIAPVASVLALALTARLRELSARHRQRGQTTSDVRTRTHSLPKEHNALDRIWREPAAAYRRPRGRD